MWKSHRVMVFGVFDGLHPGHRAFLRQAKKYGNEVIAVVARDAAVRKLKKKEPRLNEKERAVVLRRSRLADRVVRGDTEEGAYRVIRRYKPDLICLGYDQNALADDLRERMQEGMIPRIRLIRMKPYQPEKFRSSLLPRSA